MHYEYDPRSDHGNREEFRQKLLDGDREVILDALAFLLKDVSIHKKRAYLAPYLAAVEVPPEFMQDDGMSNANVEHNSRC